MNNWTYCVTPREIPTITCCGTIARYFCHYPTAIHYPFVETLFEYLAELEDDLKPQVEEMKRRHDQHSLLVDEVYALLDGACSGHMIPRDRLLKEATACVTLHRNAYDAHRH